MEIVSASKKAENVFDAPVASTVISRQEILSSGATSLPELLRLVPGVIVREKTNGNYDVHLRGLDNVINDRRLNATDNTFSLVMIDNRVVYSYFQGGTLWETLPVGIEDIDRIEIIRGPNAALYGPNAGTGVINIITRRNTYELKETNVHLTTVGGSYNTVSTNFGFLHRLNDRITVGLSGNQLNKGMYEDTYYVDDSSKYFTYDSLTNLFNADDWFSIKGNSLHTYGLNGFFNYSNTKDIDINVGFGQQGSLATLPYVGSRVLPTNRESQTKHLTLDGNIKNFHGHFAYTTGTHKLVLGLPDFNYDLAHIDGIVEYDISVGPLTIRPGLSYFSALYDVSKFVDDNSTEGFFRGSREINTFAGQLRLDYRLLDDRLRIVVAARADKYNNYEKLTPSLQIAATGKITNNHLIRLGYSSSTRAAFMLEGYTEYIMYSMGGIDVVLEGDPKIDLPKIQSVEMGIRSKWFENLQTDIEGFYSISTNYNNYKADSFMTIPYPPPGMVVPTHFSYQLLDLEARQTGVTINIQSFLSEDLSIRIFGTYQQTNLTNIPYDILYAPDSVYDSKNEWTPSLYGGLNINYRMLKSTYINLNGYGFASHKLNALYNGQEFLMNYTEQKIPATFIVNIKLSHSFTENLEIYLTARNLGASEQQFAFSQKVKAWIGAGLAFRL